MGCLWKKILYESNYYFEASPTKIQRETLKIAGRSTNFQSMFTKNLYGVKLQSCMVLTLLKNNLFVHLFLPIPDKNTLGLWISKLLQQIILIIIIIIIINNNNNNNNNNFIEITLSHGCFPVNFLHIFRTPFYKNSFGGLLVFTYIYLKFRSSWYFYSQL